MGIRWPRGVNSNVNTHAHFSHSSCTLQEVPEELEGSSTDFKLVKWSGKRRLRETVNNECVDTAIVYIPVRH